jgi:hypothetical protein
MMLVNSGWQGVESFRLMPITENCPYVECIFDPTNKLLVVISKIKKNGMHMLPRLDEMGDPIFLKVGKRNNGKVVKEERKVLETFQEYYIEEISDIEYFIEHFAVNSDKFDYKKIMTAAPVAEESSLIKEEKPQIILSTK